jgi:hypothetical protein
VIPEGQVATQPSVQGRDLLSAIALIQKSAWRSQIPLFILQQDQKKGFDMLEPQGFYDALEAYGFPCAIADLDCSTQSNVPYAVKTAYGFTDRFVVNGITKQGGSLSPLKCTLTTSLCNRWISDLMGEDLGHLLLQTQQGQRGQIHTPLDELTQSVTMVEAMDDSLLFATTFLSLTKAACDADCFQATYSWETAWNKSNLYAYHPFSFPSAGQSISIPSVDYSNPSAPTTFYHDVQVATDHTTFLCVPIDALDTHFEHLWDVISNFVFPPISCALPLTLLRRIINQ